MTFERVCFIRGGSSSVCLVRLSIFILIVLFVNARIVFGRFSSHVIFNPEEGKASEEFNELFVEALERITGCFFVALISLTKFNLVKLPNLSSAV